ncbi:MAG: RNA polymerase sigma factor [Vicinamibacterales bacterium]
MQQEGVIATTEYDDATAYRHLFEPLWRVAYLKAYRILQDSSLAENVAQDCCLKLFLHLRTLHRENLKGWIARCARNASIDLIRARAREIPMDDERPAQAPDARLDAEEQLRLRECLDALMPQHRDAVLLSKIEGQTLAEIAAALQSNVNTVGVWVSRGLRSLRSCLGQGASRRRPGTTTA